MMGGVRGGDGKRRKSGYTLAEKKSIGAEEEKKRVGTINNCGMGET